MIIHKDGNILSTETQIICQQVNCQGVMGSGLAKEIREWFPEVYIGYKKFCDSEDHNHLLGKVNFIHVNMSNNQEKYIFANIFGQKYFGRNRNTVYTDYNALRQGLESVRKYAKVSDSSVSIPYNIGCGLANGDWEIVYKIIQEVFDNDIECQIWKLQGELL